MAALDQYYETGYDSDHNFRFNAANTEHSMGFQSKGRDVSSVQLYLKKVASPTGNIYIQIQSDSGGSPNNSSLGQSGNVDVSTLSTSYDWVTFTFSTPVVVTPGTQYHIVLFGTFTIDGTNFVRWGHDQTSPTYPFGFSCFREAAAWTQNVGIDNYFRQLTTGLSAGGWFL